MLPWIITILIACSGRNSGDGESQPYDPNDQDSDVETDTDTAEDTDTDTDTDSGEDTDSGQDTDSGGDTDSGVPRGWTVVDLAPLTELSSGECPDLSMSGTSTFLSSGTERKVTVLIPAGGAEGAPVVMFFHGLTTPEASPEPTVEMADGLYLQDVADETGAVIVLPEAPLRELFGYQFYLWMVEETDSTDLTLFDDLRTCVSTELNVDLERLTAFGFSGGALFTTVVATERADTLATFIELSGGADIDVPLFADNFAAYNTPAWTLPGLVASGGDEDVWPDPSAPLVDFESASDTLADRLVTDGHFVVRCHHDTGHTITYDEYLLAIDWLSSHRFGEPSPYASAGLGDDADWCTPMGE